MAITTEIKTNNSGAVKAHMLAAFNEMADVDVIDVIRSVASERFSGSSGFDQVDAGLDRILFDFEEDAPRVRSPWSTTQDFTKGVEL